MDRSILQKIRIWLNLHLKLNTSTNKDIQISEDPISCGKKGLLSFSYRSHFLSTFKMKPGYIPLKNLVPLQRYQANQHQLFGGESICNVSKAPSVREVFGFKIPTIIGVLSKCEEDRKADLTPDLLILLQLGTQILGGRS